jgi:hypothetical protein
MELFTTILRKLLYPQNTRDELYNTYAPKLKSGVEIFTTTMTNNNVAVIYKNPKYKDFLFYLANTLLFYNISSSATSNTEKNIYTIVSIKYKFLKKNIHTFMEIVNDDFMDLFRNVQNHYMAFARLANIWKHKRSTVQIDHDLYMTPLIRTKRSVFSLLQQGKIYLFTGSNLANIIGTALSNAPNFFVEPLTVKNPYNNIPLTKSDLYNIYFFLKQSPIIMPILFHNYFMVDFDLRKFSDENENIIKNNAFNSYVRNASATSLYNSAVQMLKKYQKKIVIHKEFPKETAIQVLRPYLLLYYIIEYSSEEYRRQYAEDELKYKLKRLYKYNPLFGRKIVKMKRIGYSGRMIKITEFSTNHPYFDEPIDIQTYQRTHLEIVEANRNEDYTINNYEYRHYGGEEYYEDEHYDETQTRPQFVIVSPHPSFVIQSTLTVLPTNPTNPSNSNVEEGGDTESDSEDDEPASTIDSRYESDEVVIEGDSDNDLDDE